MSRPATHEDLPSYQREGHIVASITADYVLRYPSLGRHLVAAIAEAEHLGLEVEDGQIRMARTEEELDKALASAQSNWDSHAEGYQLALDDPSALPGWRRGVINAWASSEGRAPITWPEVSA